MSTATVLVSNAKQSHGWVLVLVSTIDLVAVRGELGEVRGELEEVRGGQGRVRGELGEVRGELEES